LRKRDQLAPGYVPVDLKIRILYPAIVEKGDGGSLLRQNPTIAPAHARQHFCDESGAANGVAAGDSLDRNARISVAQPALTIARASGILPAVRHILQPDAKRMH